MSIQVHIKKKLHNFELAIDFETNDRRIGILGASGCGKSMTLKAIAGIEAPDEGSVIIDGKSMYHSREKINVKPQKRNTGYLFQNYALFPNMNVEQNIAAGLKRGSKKDRKEKVADMIARFRLKGYEKRLPQELSGGQQQRTALARIMAYEPDVILLDEPFSAMDGYLKEILQQEMLQFLEEYKGYVILVSHSRDEIYKFSNTLLVMNQGRLIEQGATKTVFDRPKKLHTARLTGCKNISAIEKRGEHSIYARDWALTLETRELVSEQHSYVGIRAHDILPAAGEGKNKLKIALEDRLEAPFEVQYLIKKENTQVNQLLWWKIPRLHQEIPYEYGLPAYVELPPKRLLLLK